MMTKSIKSKGFTLIELLAVIVILAVITLIAVPQILNILNKARLSAAEDTTSGIIKSTENYVTSFMLQNNGGFPDGTLTFECTTDGCQLKETLDDSYNMDNLTTLDFKGTKPTSGIITISNSGKDILTTNLNINNFTCLYSKGKSSCIEKQEIKENGTKVYFNPVEGKQCSEDEYTEDQSQTGITEGCMQWYIFNDNEGSAVYTLILDHNITNNVKWYTTGDNTKGPKEVLEALRDATTDWSDELISPTPYTASWTYDGQPHSYTIDYSTYGNKSRLISAEEIAEITGASKSIEEGGIGWTLQDGDWFFLDGAESNSAIWRTQVANSSKTSKYAWLFDNTSDCINNEETCINYGCNVEQSGTFGYWTSSPSNYNYFIYSNAWSVFYKGHLNRDTISHNDRYGVRPVITVKKSDLLLDSFKF